MPDLPDACVPPEPRNARSGFPALGPVARPLAPPPVGVPGPSASLDFTAGPNPSRGAVELTLPSAGTVSVHDASGRMVRRFAAATRARWDGCDARGRSTPPGLYLIRFEDRRGTHVTRRVVRL